MKICLKSGICQVLQRSRQLMWCHSGVGWWLPAMPSLKSESGADSLFQPTWVMLWRVFWKTKITNIYTRLPKAKADPEEGGMGQQEKILTSNLQLNPISFQFFSLVMWDSQHVWGQCTCALTLYLVACAVWQPCLFYILNKQDFCCFQKYIVKNTFSKILSGKSTTLWCTTRYCSGLL